MSIKALIAAAHQALMDALMLDSKETTLEAQLLLQHVLQVNRAWLISHENDVLPAAKHAEFGALLKRRLAGEPIAHILGRREFYGLDLIVTADTLIPRPDTETLVEAALEKLLNPSFQRKLESSSNKKIDSSLRWNDGKEISPRVRVLDLGTGTGAIALAIASQRNDLEIIAVDASAAALNVAIQNAEKLNLNNVRFLQSNWFSAMENEKFDAIVSNPPYIAQSDPHLSQGDLRFEPLAALAAGPDGLDAIRRIVQQAPAHLKHAGWLLLEHGFDQAERVAGLMRQAGFAHIAHAHDLAGIARVTLGQAK